MSRVWRCITASCVDIYYCPSPFPHPLLPLPPSPSPLRLQEAHEETRSELLAALGDWLSLVSAFPPSTLEALKKGLSGPRDTALAHLASLRVALTAHPDLAGQMTGLSEPLLKLVKDASKKPGSAGGECLLALHCLLDLSAVKPEFDTQLSDAHPPSALSDPSSWLYATNLRDGLQTQPLVARALVAILLAGLGNVGVGPLLIGDSASSEAEETLGQRSVTPASLALVDLLLHPDKDVRALVYEGLQERLVATPEACPALLKALWVRVDQVCSSATFILSDMTYIHIEIVPWSLIGISS